MARANKLSTFGGVFTPSILTILGVIMYLRLPWVVGQAGLYATLAIIIVSHIISVTTGLSVSSIATDKKVKVGGNYYIISRSLGLPLGGTLGIALFVGLSFSVSLYIIGFIESFLPAMGIEVTKQTIRLYGTMAVLFVSGIILISTSFAIKVQYLILTAIGLSLVSILAGSPESVPSQPHLTSEMSTVPMMTLFGIFFPAVTGFTAGVQMSGDLKDPKKAIPIGTIASITTGFIVYIGLAIFLAYRVDPESLIGNTNVLREISWIPAFLFAGIWGATLSSAMGSLLGAPRILQATSMDHITPRFFAKGYGPNNEPRNALILTFVIAEGGILIAELNVIAAVISVFFITTYGFINLSCAVENWASTDFRPSFRIPTWVSVLGAVFCFIVMVQLDLLSFIAASGILGLLLLYLKRKELTLESGDTWEGIWSSVIRASLQRISQEVTHTRNWRPNIILFSGGTSVRPHLIEFGKWIVRRRGILSNFDLIENRKEHVLFSKAQQALTDSGEVAQGIYSRRLGCRNIYEGMESIAQVYGFSGIEPNSVMMGWARNTQDPIRFAHMVRFLSELDYNILMLDYDREKAFGDKSQIDLWWRGGNNNATLALTILKFLQASEEWNNALARILILIDDSALANKAYKNMKRILDDQRIDAFAKVINASIEKRTFVEICKEESAEADLIMLGIPEITDQNAARFVANTNSIVAELGSTLLVYASSYFKPLYIGIESAPDRTELEATKEAASHLPELRFPEKRAALNDILVHTLREICTTTEAMLQSYCDPHIRGFLRTDRKLAEDFQKLIERDFDQLEEQLESLDPTRFRRLVAKIQGDFYFNAHRLLEKHKRDGVNDQKEALEAAIDHSMAEMDSILAATDEKTTVIFETSAVEPGEGDDFHLRATKLYHRLERLFKKGEIKVALNLQKAIAYHLHRRIRQAILDHLAAAGVESYEFVTGIEKWLNSASDALKAIASKTKSRELAIEGLRQHRQDLCARLTAYARQHTEKLSTWQADLLRTNRENLQDMVDRLFELDANRYLRKRCRTGKTATELKAQILEIPERWQNNQQLVINFALMDLSLMVLKVRLRTILNKANDELQLDVEENVLDKLADLEEVLGKFEADMADGGDADFVYKQPPQYEFDEQVFLKLLEKDIQAAIEELPEEINLISEESFRELATQQFQRVQVSTVNLRRWMDYLIETDFVDSFQQYLAKLPKELQHAVNVAEDVMRLVQFNVARHDPSSEEDTMMPEEPLAAIVQDAIGRLAEERKKVKACVVEAVEQSQQELEGVFDKMNPYLLLKSSDRLGYHLRSHESRKVLSRFDTWRHQIATYVRSRSVRLLYSKTEGVLLAQRFAGSADEQRTQIDGLLSFCESVSPKPQIMSVLPHYYRQLFIGKQPIRREFWVGRKDELSQGRKTIERYRQGFRGGLLVLGEPNSGKTALCRKIAEQSFDQNRIFHIFPPEGGSTDTDRFRSQIQAALEFRSNGKGLYQAIPKQSCVVLHDLSMWWERSPQGLAVLDEIVELVNQFGDRCFFIANADTFSFRFIDRLRPLHNLFLATIACHPFDAEELQQAVLLRHRSSGIQFELEGKRESQISEFSLAALFTKLFNHTNGNVGFAFLTWLRDIVKFSPQLLMIRSPESPDLSPLRRLEEEGLVLLQQLLLHKQMSQHRLQNVMGEDESTIANSIGTMMRAGLVVEKSGGIYSPNPFVQPYLIRILKERDWL